MNQVQAQLCNLQAVDAKELGEVVDMIKDLEETMYYCTIIEAMEGKGKEKYNNHVSCLFLRGGKNLDFDNSSPYKFNIGDVKICRGNNFNFKGWFSQEGLDDRFSIYSKLYDWYKNLEIK